MAAPTKAGTAERYWREVEGLSRLEMALLRDQELPPEEHARLAETVALLKSQLVEIVKTREGGAPGPVASADPSSASVVG